MLLVHAAGSVKVGEVYRYTITYTPSDERVLPIPERLYLRIKNLAYLPLRAAYLKGPYTLYVSVRRAEFDPYIKQSVSSSDDPGIPLFDPHLKAGAAFNASLPVPESIRRTVDILGQRGRKTGVFATQHPPDEDKQAKSVTWIVEIASQIIFSKTSTIPFEVLLGRNEQSLNFVPQPSPAPTSPLFVNPFAAAPPPPKPKEPEENEHGDLHVSYDQGPPGALSRSIRLKTQNTKDLWNTPPFPSWNDPPGEYAPTDPKDYPDPGEADELEKEEEEEVNSKGETKSSEKKRRTKRRTRRVHLVILTHGLHSNVGADMLFMKEQIDEDARRTAEAIKKKCEEDRANGLEVDDEEPELVLVRGYEGNSCKTERGIKYLGKHLAKYVINLTKSPQTPVCTKHHRHFHPHLTPAARDPSLYCGPSDIPPYRITSISFIGHSLGGLVQTYAIAYIQKNHPTFFDEIKPINFVALATPFLGLSNENPLHVRFALDFGLVGRTGQDLGLSWRAPSAAASAISNAFQMKPSKTDTSKPLLRILPTGPAHEVLRKFRNRTVYANVVNDGIVPLRTSCLLFLDWKGLGKVEKARKENGAMIVGGLVHWGWDQLTNSGSTGNVMSGSGTPTVRVSSPEPEINVTKRGAPLQEINQEEDTKTPTNGKMTDGAEVGIALKGEESKTSPFEAFMTLLRPHASSKARKPKIYKRSQTLQSSSTLSLEEPGSSKSEGEISNNSLSPHSFQDETGRRKSNESFIAPPRTTLLEVAGDVLNPPLPTTEYIIDPSSRPRTIFHDRIYHPEDIPPLPPRPSSSRSMTFSHRSTNSSTLSPPPTGKAPSTPSPIASSNIFSFPFMQSSTAPTPQQSPTAAPLKVEEKIARAYHHDLSWRKVLVRLEPDAHNNMIVRRMFANAYGWPVVKHVVETHFADTSAANLPDSEESNAERALDIETGEGKSWVGGDRETIRDEQLPAVNRRRSATVTTEDSAKWTDTAFDLTDSTTSSEIDPYASSPSSPSSRSPSPVPFQHPAEASTATLIATSSTSSRPTAQPQLSQINAIAIPQPAHLASPSSSSAGAQLSLPSSWSGSLFWQKRTELGQKEGGVVSEAEKRLRSVEGSRRSGSMSGERRTSFGSRRESEEGVAERVAKLSFT